MQIRSVSDPVLNPDVGCGGDLRKIEHRSGGAALADRFQLLAALDDQLIAQGGAMFLLADLDNFRLINESFGYPTGDQVLLAVAERLAAAAHDGDIVGHLAGDEFGVLCPHDATVQSSLEWRLRQAVLRPLIVGDHAHIPTLSLGMSHLGPGQSTIDVLATANAAMRLAKERGRNRCETFDSGMADIAIATLRRTAELRSAIAADQLLLHYQPIINLESGTLVGCEALLRWEHPEEGTIPAAAFVGMLESSGLIAEVTPLVVRAACRAAAALAGTVRTGTAPFVAINLSSRELAEPGLVDLIRTELAAAAITPQQLTIELTESAVLADAAAVAAVLRSLRRSGMGVTLDDFGTGHSTLLHLKHLPISSLKLDQTFVQNLTFERDDLAIVASVVHLAATLGLQSIAAGVESQEQADKLRSLGCALGQGHLFGMPLPLDRLIAQHSTPDPSRLKWVHPNPATEARILSLHHGGASLHTIAAALNADGSRTNRGVRWSSRSIAHVVSEAAFPGLRAR